MTDEITTSKKKTWFKKASIFIGIVAIFTISYYYYFFPYPKGTIIILNGPSASGKTSIQKHLLELLEEPYLKIGIDNFFIGVLPNKFLKNKKNIKDIMEGVISFDDKGPLYTLKFKPKGKRIISGMHHAIAAYASQGNNVVVDYILYDKKWLKELVNVLQDFKVYFIGIRIPLEVLEKRERQRATSPIGHARTHYDIVHSHNTYDFELDSSIMSSEQAAKNIIRFIKNNPNPKAFEKLS